MQQEAMGATEWLGSAQLPGAAESSKSPQGRRRMRGGGEGKFKFHHQHTLNLISSNPFRHPTACKFLGRYCHWPLY